VSVYVYGLTYPGSDEVGYVGVSADPWKRHAEHCRSSFKTPVRKWIETLGERPGLVILDAVEGSVDIWAIGLEPERNWIARLRAEGHRLINKKGLPRSPEVREKIRQARLGRTHSQQTKQRISEAMILRSLEAEVYRAARR
jgi:hypothetical protein